jgi:hypothetical protein
MLSLHHRAGDTGKAGLWVQGQQASQRRHEKGQYLEADSKSKSETLLNPLHSKPTLPTLLQEKIMGKSH